MVRELRQVRKEATVALCSGRRVAGLSPVFRDGAMTEWLKVHAWKACVRQRTEGSNPSRSAIYFRNSGNKPKGPPFQAKVFRQDCARVPYLGPSASGPARVRLNERYLFGLGSGTPYPRLFERGFVPALQQEDFSCVKLPP